LGIGVIDADHWLAQRGVPLNYSVEDFKADQYTLRELRGQASR